MRVIVLGASGATGIHAVQQLRNNNCLVTALIRPQGNYPKAWEDDKGIDILKEHITTFDMEKMKVLLSNTDAVVSCLGHNLSFKGLFGKPQRLVTDAIRNVCLATDLKRDAPLKIVLMNTAGNQNRDLNENVSFGEKIVIGLIRLLLPPHVDNEQAADYLRLSVGQNNPAIQWVAIRPDSLINKDVVTKYDVYPSPIRSAIFNPGKSSRINVGHFMASLLSNDILWNEWKGQMPVIYNID